MMEFERHYTSSPITNKLKISIGVLFSSVLQAAARRLTWTSKINLTLSLSTTVRTVHGTTGRLRVLSYSIKLADSTLWRV
jgi:hypothetical protein